MATEKTYNGWTNYETWAVKLWMDNEEGSYRGGQSMAEDAWESAETDSTFTRLERATLDLARTLRNEYEEARPEVPGVWGDLLGAALSEVNWDEIAANMLEDVAANDEVECIYCGMSVPKDDTVPALDDDAEWEELAELHGDHCEWCNTRAHRRNA